MRRVTRLYIVFIFGIFFISCSNRSQYGAQTQSQPTVPNWPTGQELDSIFSKDTSTVGSGTSGGLTEADKYSLKNVFQEQAAIEPLDDGGLSEELKQEAQRLLKEEEEGKQVAAEKMALAGRMLSECANRVAPLAPIAGQPLLGQWESTDKSECKVKFTISGGNSNATYTVSGEAKGTMQATPVGDGTLQVKPYDQGRLTDRPEAGKGVLTITEFKETKYGYDPCSTQVKLKTSANPIPENYKEAMKKMGKCFRQALVLMSPVFDDMFKNMDPQLRYLIQARMLGLSTNSY